MANQFGQLAAQITEAQGSARQTKPLHSSGHKRAFVREYQRWALLFRCKDTGDTESEKWLIAEYYESLQYLSEEGFVELTKLLKANCTFFPTIRECLDLMKPKDRYDWGHPFLAAHNGTATPLLRNSPSPSVLAMQNRAQLTGPDGLTD
jgi:hypothetical protein